MFRAFFRRLTLSVSIVVLLLLSLTSLSFPAHAAANNITPRGGVNMDGYCKSIGDRRASLDGKTAYDWRCVTPSGQHVGINMTDACNWQYNWTTVARVADFYNPSSWQCWD